MADTRISALTDGAPAQGTEDVPVALSGANYRLTTGDIALLALQDTFQGAITVDAATTAVLAGSPTYANGAAGVGATLTRGSNGVMATIDGVAAVAGNTYLIKNQASALQNGVYELTTLGSAGAPYVLTRTTDSDAIAELYPQAVIVAAGTTNKRKIFSQTNAALATIGTDSINYGTTPAPNLTGYVKADCTVDFIGPAAQTWDYGGTDTTTVEDVGIVVSDATDSIAIVKDQITATNGTAVAGFTRLGVGVADGGANQANIVATESNVIGANGEVRIYEDRIKMVHGATSAAMEKKFIKVLLSAAQIQTGNSVPVEVLAAAAGGEVNVPTSILYAYTANTTPFTSSSFHLDTSGAANGDGLFYSAVNILTTGLDVKEMMTPNYDTAVFRTCAAGAAIVFMTDSDSGVGDGTIDLYIEYNIITL